FGGADTLATLQVEKGNLLRTLLVGAVLGSLCSDWIARLKVAGTHLDWYQLEQLPLPFQDKPDVNSQSAYMLIQNAARLTFIHRRFAPGCLRLKHLYPDLAAREWKHWWAVTETDRLRLRVEIDALAADLYGLSPDDFDWIVRDDPTDPKGFYRVDRH